MHEVPADPEAALVGRAPALAATLRAARLVAATDVAVLIQGESGTGKELLAREIHRCSRRRDKPFVAVNCAALPETLAESLLFGHRRGAFTGAEADAEGLVGAARGGTLFLDEIGELPLSVQPKLLRFLESGEYLRLGDGRPARANVRVLAATHRDLQQEVRAGRFREDLYYRLNVVPLSLPPLRERREDIPRLVEHFNRTLAAAWNLEPLRYDEAALEALRAYDWPGNVRELRNLCERLLVLLQGTDAVTPLNLPEEIRTPAGIRATDSPDEPVRLPEGGLRLEEVEISLLRQALERTGGNRSAAARLLGISRDTLLYRLRKYALR
ncbi:MAG: AAA family ATPase [Gammaproteobacteria bacterium]|nr:MAG: AAA family ATPase [Gammaproteobacteria bacterium]